MPIRMSLSQAKRLGVSKEIIESAKQKSHQHPPGGGNSPIQQILWEAVKKRWPQAQSEYKGAVPGRRFRLDIALADEKIAIEADGWTKHAQHKSDFKRHLRRQNLLTISGWRILRFGAEDIYKDLDGCMRQIEQAMTLTM